MPLNLTAAGLWKYIAAWVVMLLVSIANGAVRDFTYGKHLNELTTHQISTASGILVLGVIIWAFCKIVHPSSAQEALSVGLFWATLTIAFEFVFFHYVGGHSWSRLLENYNVAKGRVWVFLLFWIAFAPYIFFRLRVAKRGNK